jgi:iron complex outermembrane receptor protein
MYDWLDSLNLSEALSNLKTDQHFEQTNAAWNVGADGHYDFLEEGMIPWFYQVSAEASARYNWEHRIFDLGAIAERASNFGGATANFISLAPQTERKTWRAVTGHFALEWKPAESLTLYAKYTRGMKVGHFNAGLSSEPGRDTTQSIAPVDPEFIHSAELGVNASMFDESLQFNLALFRYWYTDLQVFDIVNEPNTQPTQQLLNSDANVFGFEAEGSYDPTWWFFEGLSIDGGFAWLDSEFVDFLVSKAVAPGSKGNPPQQAIFDYSGNPLIASPEWSWSGVVEWELPISRWGFIVPRYDFSYKSKVFLDPSTEKVISQDPYWLHHAALAYRSPDGRVEVSGWVRNFLEEEYKIDVFDFTRQFEEIIESWGEPRTYGFTVSLSW